MALCPCVTHNSIPYEEYVSVEIDNQCIKMQLAPSILTEVSIDVDDHFEVVLGLFG